MLPPINFKNWINENRHLLKPPVGNKLVWEDREFFIMVVGGPNSRTDFHVNLGEEFYFQVEGDIVLKVMENGKPVDISIKEGDIFLLPPKTPHSPQRPANTVGLVVERRRRPDELDAFEWYCEKCGTQLYREEFHLHDVVQQFPPIFDRFFADVNHTTCKKCNFRMLPPKSKAISAASPN